MTDAELNRILASWGGGTVHVDYYGEMETRPACVVHIDAMGNFAWFEPAYLDPYNASPAYRVRGPLISANDKRIEFEGGYVTPPIDEHKESLAWWLDQVKDPEAEAARVIADMNP